MTRIQNDFARQRALGYRAIQPGLMSGANVEELHVGRGSENRTVPTLFVRMKKCAVCAIRLRGLNLALAERGTRHLKVVFRHIIEQLACLPYAYPNSDWKRLKSDKPLISLAHPTRFERVTFAFGEK
jgi:hypothetical protein